MKHYVVKNSPPLKTTKGDSAGDEYSKSEADEITKEMSEAYMNHCVKTDDHEKQEMTEPADLIAKTESTSAEATAIEIPKGNLDNISVPEESSEITNEESTRETTDGIANTEEDTAQLVASEN